MKNIIRIALGTTVAALGVVAFTPNVNAQTVNVDFTGTIPFSCTISNQSAGTLVLVSPKNLAGGVGGGSGTRAAFTANCNAPAMLQISSITANGSSYTAEGVFAAPYIGPSQLNFATRSVSMANGVPTPTAGGGSQAVPAGSVDYTVGLDIGNTSLPLPVGSYNTRVSVLFAAP